jgi:hypothetical protein
MTRPVRGRALFAGWMVGALAVASAAVTAAPSGAASKPVNVKIVLLAETQGESTAAVP